MPLYDYGCKDCKKEWEVFHKMSEKGPSECPSCGSSNVSKLISAVHGSVILTGRELNQKIKEDARKLQREAATNEKVLANLVGEDKYQGNVTTSEKIVKDFKND